MTQKTKIKLAAVIAGLCMIAALMTLQDFLAEDPKSRVYSVLKFLALAAPMVFCIPKLAGMQRVLGWLLLIAGTIGGAVIGFFLIASKGQAGGYELAACVMLALPIGYLLVFDRDLGMYRLTLSD
jgi:hypothetical protein